MFGHCLQNKFYVTLYLEITTPAKQLLYPLVQRLSMRGLHVSAALHIEFYDSPVCWSQGKLIKINDRISCVHLAYYTVNDDLDGLQ
jgi:hypothetical protein